MPSSSTLRSHPPKTGSQYPYLMAALARMRRRESGDASRVRRDEGRLRLPVSLRHARRQEVDELAHGSKPMTFSGSATKFDSALMS